MPRFNLIKPDPVYPAAYTSMPATFLADTPSNSDTRILLETLPSPCAGPRVQNRRLRISVSLYRHTEKYADDNACGFLFHRISFLLFVRFVRLLCPVIDTRFGSVHTVADIGKTGL